MEVSVVLFTPRIHVLACMLLRSVALCIKHVCLWLLVGETSISLEPTWLKAAMFT